MFKNAQVNCYENRDRQGLGNTHSTHVFIQPALAESLPRPSRATVSVPQQASKSTCGRLETTFPWWARTGTAASRREGATGTGWGDGYLRNKRWLGRTLMTRWHYKNLNSVRWEAMQGCSSSVHRDHSVQRPWGEGCLTCSGNNKESRVAGSEEKEEDRWDDRLRPRAGQGGIEGRPGLPSRLQIWFAMSQVTTLHFASIITVMGAAF